VDKLLLSVTHGQSAMPDLGLPSQPKLVLIVPTHPGTNRARRRAMMITDQDQRVTTTKLNRQPSDEHNQLWI